MKKLFKQQKNKIRADMDMVQVKSVHCNKKTYPKSAEWYWMYGVNVCEHLQNPVIN